MYNSSFFFFLKCLIIAVCTSSAMSHASGDLQQIDWEDWESAVESKEVVILSLIANYEPTNVKETEEALANGTKTSTTPSDVLDFSLREVLTLLKDESLAERAAVYYA